ncbi:MAG: acyl-CoA dehydrogenase family protein [Xanthobacteraceae bacterium]|jgi:alkylation response protein AidB-like acyl-CoA dehydrogenase
MDLHLTSEQTLLRDSAAKFIAAAGAKVARGFREQDPSFAPARLRQAGELGWLGILVPNSANGAGLGLTELALVLEQAGRGLVCEPIGLAAISAAALAQGHSPHPMLGRVMAGEALVVPALQENVQGDDPLAPRTRVAGQDGALLLTGRKMFVCAGGADGFLVSASGRDGPTLYYVARNAPGCMLTTTQTVEGRKLSTLRLEDAPADLVPSRQSSRNAVDALHNLALIALSAELLGVMEKAQEITFEYLRIRKQFGKLIGSFQALQHQAVDLYIRTETTRSLVFQVAANNDPYRIDPALAVAVKAKASDDALFVTKACIQLHGAIGFTDEHDIGLYLKRAMLLSSLFGNAAAQRRRYVAIAGLNA